jgi:hypothetical protein
MSIHKIWHLERYHLRVLTQLLLIKLKTLKSDFYDKNILLGDLSVLMIKLKNVTLRNFLSVGSVTQAVNLDNQELTLILGNPYDNLDLRW